MTIRNRLTFWYGGILLASLTIMAGVLHHEWFEQQNRSRADAKALGSPWEETGEVILYYGLPTAVILLVGGWILLGKAMAPVTALTRAAERINLDNLQERLPTAGKGDELDRLTQVFNAMMTRLENSFARVREFTLHASHELKTPLTVMRAATEFRLREGQCDPSDHEHLASQLDEIQRLTRIVDALSFLCKADAGQAALRQETVRFDELVKDSFADAQVLARPREIHVELTDCKEITVRGDRHRLRQLLLNLTDNAVKYNQPKGRVRFSLHRHNGAVELKIANTGPGIPSEKLPLVFERFFRGDCSHNSEVEGCGLGLSIAEWIVKAHAGQIRVASDPARLTTVTVILPISKDAVPDNRLLDS